MYLSEPLGIGEVEQALSVRTSGPDDAVESVPADPGFALPLIRFPGPSGSGDNQRMARISETGGGETDDGTGARILAAVRSALIGRADLARRPRYTTDEWAALTREEKKACSDIGIAAVRQVPQGRVRPDRQARAAAVRARGAVLDRGVGVLPGPHGRGEGGARAGGHRDAGGAGRAARRDRRS